MSAVVKNMENWIEESVLGLKKVKLLEVKDEVFEYYKSHLRGNSNDSRLDCRKKLTRNWDLATPLMNTTTGETRMYGNLKITVLDGEVRCIKNYYGGAMNKIDRVEKERLNKVYRIK